MRMPLALKYLTVVLLVAVAVGSAPATAEEKAAARTVEVVGSASLHGDNTASAREQAISGCLVSAMARVTAELLPLETFVRNFQVLDEIFLGRNKQFVRDYKVLTETVNDKEYRVLVQVSIFADLIREQLSGIGLLQGQQAMPTVLLALTEKNFNDILPKHWWGDDLVFVPSITERAVAEMLTNKGFRVADSHQVTRPFNLRLELLDEEAVNLANQLQADVVIVGQAKASPGLNTMGANVRSYKGTVAAKALRADTGEEIARINTVALTANVDEVAGGTEALMKAASEAGAELAERVAAAWQPRRSRAGQVEVFVRGTAYLSNFVTFRKLLENTEGVNGFQIRELKPDAAMLVVDFQGSAQSLADHLILNAYGSFGINVFDVTETAIGLELVP